MAIGILNPGDVTNSTNTRPVGPLSAVNQRRWFSGDLNTELKDQDLNAILAQIRHVIDYYGVTDVEGDDTLLRQAIASGATSLSGNVAALQGLLGVTDSVPYFTSPATMSSFIASPYSRGLLAKTSIVQWQAELGIGAGSSPNVIALGGLASGADQLPYFTGLGVMGQTPFTAAARALLDDVDTAAMRTTLGLGTGATATIANYALISGVNFTGPVTVAANPTLALGVATKQMVDLKAPAESPTFTGVPAAPTATQGTNTTQLATTAFVTTAVGAGGFAPLASPAFTGVPTAPTAAPATSTTQIATTAFVAVSYAPLTSPALLGAPTAPTPTLGDNSTRIATTAFVAATAFGGYAPISSPAFTGIPTAPTAAPGTNSTQLATTAFVANSFAPLASPTLAGVPAAPTASPGTATTQLATTAFVTAADNLKANISNPAFTGSPTAPTAVLGTNTAQLATTAYVVQGFAPLASPNFTGTPTAPTAVPGVNTTQLATTAFVTAAVTTGVATYAPLASPALTGTPTAPTAAAGTNTTQLATTAFVTASNSGANTLTALLTVDGVGSLLDADLLDGQHGSYYQSLANATGTLADARLVGAYTGITALSITGAFTGTSALAASYNLIWGNTGGPVSLLLQSGNPTTNKDTYLGFYRGGFPRWFLTRQGTAEAGGASRTGSDLTLDWSSDDGLTSGNVFTVRRSTAVMEFTASPTAPTPTAGDSSTKLATTAFVSTATAGITGFAPLASPAFTGIPTAPTAAPGTNTTQLATTAYVQGLVAGTGYAPIDNPTFTGVVTAPQFIATGGTITANAPGLDVTQTWNNGAATFYGIRANFVTTAFNGATSYLMDVQVGGVSKFGIDISGIIYCGGGMFGVDINTAGIMLDGGSTVVGFNAVAGKYQLTCDPAYGVATIAVASDCAIGWNNDTNLMSSPLQDTLLYRDAAGVLALRRTTFAQTLRIYNSWTDASNGEWLSLGYATNVAQITHKNVGTGVASRTLQVFAGLGGMYQFGANNSVQWAVPATGHLTALTDNAFDIGALGATRPRTLYLGTSVNVASGTLTANTPAIDVTQTWNNAASTFTAIRVNVTRTASGSPVAKLIDLQLAGVSVFSVNYGGTMASLGGFVFSPTGVVTEGLMLDASGYLSYYTAAGGYRWEIQGQAAANTAVYHMASDLGIGWNATTNLSTLNIDTTLYRDAANTIAQRRLANAQAFRIYNTTDATNTNYERAELVWSGNVFTIQTSAGGTGVKRPLAFAAGTTAAASLRVLTGVAPTSPVDGDIWFTGTALQMRIGGVTRTVTVT